MSSGGGGGYYGPEELALQCAKRVGPDDRHNLDKCSSDSSTPGRCGSSLLSSIGEEATGQGGITTDRTIDPTCGELPWHLPWLVGSAACGGCWALVGWWRPV